VRKLYPSPCGRVVMLLVPPAKSSRYLDFHRATHNQQQRTNRMAHIVFETIRDRDCLKLVSSDDYELIYSIGEKNIGDELTSAGRPIKAYHAT
jgi:hypothetical protein